MESTWLLLLLLLCPLMMLPMMFGMKGSHSHKSNAAQTNQAIQDELNELKKQNEEMKKEIQNLSR